MAWARMVELEVMKSNQISDILKIVLRGLDGLITGIRQRVKITPTLGGMRNQQDSY